jgi:hypothetical protein
MQLVTQAIIDYLHFSGQSVNAAQKNENRKKHIRNIA